MIKIKKAIGMVSNGMSNTKICVVALRGFRKSQEVSSLRFV